jgi:hypothetical protein
VVARAAGATGDEIEVLADALARCGEVKTERARALLDELRARHAATKLEDNP